MDFSDDFHRIEKFVQVETAGGRKNLLAKLNKYKCQITVLNIQSNRTTARFRI
jgi:hypothetical protein